MIKFDKDEFFNPTIYSTNDECQVRCAVQQAIVNDIKILQLRTEYALGIIVQFLTGNYYDNKNGTLYYGSSDGPEVERLKIIKEILTGKRDDEL